MKDQPEQPATQRMLLKVGLDAGRIRVMVAPMVPEPPAWSPPPRPKPPREKPKQTWATRKKEDITRYNHERAAADDRGRKRRVANAMPACIVDDPKLTELVETVSRERGVPSAAILSKLKIATVVKARQEVWVRARELGMHETHISTQFNCHRTTVLHAWSTYAQT